MTNASKRPVQLELPHEIVNQFRMEGGLTSRLIEYDADGKHAPKYRPVHWHDWMREQTKPWKPPGPRKTPLDLKKLGELGLAEIDHNGQKWSNPKWQ